MRTRRDILTPVLVISAIVVAILFLWAVVANAQTHTMPGSNVVPSGASLTINSGGSITAAAGSTVTGFGGGTGTVTSITATTPIVVTPSPLVATGVVSLDPTTKSNWDTAFAQVRQWDGGSTGLVAATGRTSLGLGTAATTNATAYEVPLTFSTGLTRTTNTVTVNTSQNIATLSNLTTNGFVKTGGAVGTLSVDTATYQAASANLTTWAGIAPTTVGQSFVTLANPGAITFPEISATNVVSTKTAAQLKTDLSLTATDVGLGSVTNNAQTQAAIVPNTAPATGKILIGNGSSYSLSTPTWPTTAGTAGYTVRSDGTNFVSYPQDMYNSSTTGVSSSYAADTYVAGSAVVVAAGDFKAKGQYHCIFDMSKTAAGVATPIITLRVGTAGTTADSAILTFTFGAGTAVVDNAIFEVWATFRTVGSGTSAVVAGMSKGVHNLSTTGMFNNANVFFVAAVASSGFATNTATTIGVSFNGGSAFVGGNGIVQATLIQ